MTKPKLNNPYQVSLLVEAQATYYPNMVSVYIPKQPIVKRGSGNKQLYRSTGYRLADGSDSEEGELNLELMSLKSKPATFLLLFEPISSMIYSKGDLSVTFGANHG